MQPVDYFLKQPHPMRSDDEDVVLLGSQKEVGSDFYPVRCEEEDGKVVEGCYRKRPLPQAE